MRMCQQRFYLTSLNVATIFVIEFNVYYFAVFCSLVVIVMPVLVLQQLSDVAHRLLPQAQTGAACKKTSNRTYRWPHATTASCNFTYTTKSGTKKPPLHYWQKSATLTAKHRNNGCHFGEIFCCCFGFFVSLA